MHWHFSSRGLQNTLPLFYAENQNIILIFLRVWVLVHILMLVKAISEGRSESKVKISRVNGRPVEIKSEGIVFWEVGDVEFPPYHGEVEVFICLMIHLKVQF